MPATELRPAFRQRLRVLTQLIWALHVGQGFARTTLAAIILLAAAAAVDYIFELSPATRTALFASGLVVVLLLVLRWVVRPARTWRRDKVVMALEGLFPILGQRLRTVLEHGEKPADQLARTGVDPALVVALEAETTERAK